MDEIVCFNYKCVIAWAFADSAYIIIQTGYTKLPWYVLVQTILNHLITIRTGLICLHVMVCVAT